MAPKTFYTEKARLRADHDHTVSGADKFHPVTPPSSACLITFGCGVRRHAARLGEGLDTASFADIDAARAELVERGVEVSEVQKFDWGSFVFFEDPDGNSWSVQQIPSGD